MKRVMLAVCALAVFSSIFPPQAICGERRKRNDAEGLALLSQAGSTKEEKKQALINNFNAMRSQELRVILLQQMLNEEGMKLSNIQEQFCSLYNLNVNKLRQGLYRYDDAQEKFVEVAPQFQQQLPVTQ